MQALFRNVAQWAPLDVDLSQFASSYGPYSPQTSLSFLLVVLMLSLGEFFWRRRKGQSYDGTAVLSTLVVAVGQALSRVPTAGLITAALFAAHAFAPFKLSAVDWQTWVVGFFGVEFFYYWQHRFFHTIRWFWATHSVHHSPNEFTLPVAFRLGWTLGISGGWIFLVPLAFLGIPPAVIGTLYVLNLRYQFFLHTESIGRLGPLEWVLNTPSHHRVHHGANPEYLDKNYGGVLIVFDRLFGTFAAENPRTDIQYGLTDPITSKNPLVIVFREWGRMFSELRRVRSVRAALKTLFGRPSDAWREARALDLLEKTNTLSSPYRPNSASVPAE